LVAVSFHNLLVAVSFHSLSTWSMLLEQRILEGDLIHGDTKNKTH